MLMAPSSSLAAVCHSLPNKIKYWHSRHQHKSLLLKENMTELKLDRSSSVDHGLLTFGAGEDTYLAQTARNRYFPVATGSPDKQRMISGNSH